MAPILPEMNPWTLWRAVKLLRVFGAAMAGRHLCLAGIGDGGYEWQGFGAAHLQVAHLQRPQRHRRLSWLPSKFALWLAANSQPARCPTAKHLRGLKQTSKHTNRKQGQRLCAGGGWWSHCSRLQARPCVHCVGIPEAWYTQCGWAAVNFSVAIWGTAAKDPMADSKRAAYKSLSQYQTFIQKELPINGYGTTLFWSTDHSLYFSTSVVEYSIVLV